jgi:predicted RND superfamily exporter protein
MSETTQKERAFVIAIFIALFLVTLYVIKKLMDAAKTETPVTDDTTKAILNDKTLTDEFYKAIENEKEGGDTTIKVNGHRYKVVRAGHAQPVMSS